MGALCPHPPIIIPEIGKNKRQKVKKTINSFQDLAEEISELDIDLLITISPHGPVFRDAISVSRKDKLTGDFSDFGYPEITFEEKNHINFINNLGEAAGKVDIDLITLPSSRVKRTDYNTELDHGVLVPLYFLKNAGVDVSLVALTMGLLPYNKLYSFGTLITQVLEEMGLDAVVVASGDLSHRLKPGAPAGYNPRGEEFDKKLIELLVQKKFKEIMELDSVLIKKAGECGLRPIIMMLGAFDNLEVKTDVKSYEGPFGVGYGVAGIYPQN